MTKKDYTALAAAILKLRDEPDEHGYVERTKDNTLDEVTMSIAAVLQRDSPRFDATRFRRGCHWPQRQAHPNDGLAEQMKEWAEQLDIDPSKRTISGIIAGLREVARDIVRKEA